MTKTTTGQKNSLDEFHWIPEDAFTLFIIADIESALLSVDAIAYLNFYLSRFLLAFINLTFYKHNFDSVLN